MFDIGPEKLLVLLIIGLILLGPDRLPSLARDAARMIRILRDAATGAREEITAELGPEFAAVDLRSLNPRTAIHHALLGEDSTETAAEDPATRPLTAASSDSWYDPDTT